MSKHRQRALKALFKRAHGRPPAETTLARGGYYTSEWRRLKKNYIVQRRGRP